MTSSMNGSVLSPLRRENSTCISDLKATSKCLRLHLNSLWSIWYGLCVATFNGYIVLQSTKRYFDYEDLRLASDEENISTNELNVCIGLTGISVLFLPFFLMSAIFKVGNLANDGFKLGRNLNACSADPPAGIAIAAKNGCQRLWQHCGPTAGLFHLVMAFCVLIPKLIMEARLIQMTVLPKDSIWKTDLDFLIPHHEHSLTTFNFTNSSHGSTAAVTFNSSSSSSNPTVIASTTSTAIRAHPKHAAFVAAASHEILTEDTINVGGSLSIELLNYALALLIYSVRYPSVFWSTNKCFGLLFSIQLLINSVQCLLLHCGICILYKIHVIGSKEQLPYLMVPMNKLFLRFGKPFILNKDVTLTLYVMSIVLVLMSSLVLYLYGYSRLNSFLHREQARRIISIRDLHSGRTWGYFTHCVALCVLVAIAVCEAPLLYDLSVVYRGSLDNLVLVIISASILHLFVWVLLWLILTLKQHWEFKLRVTVGHAAVRSAKSIKLVTDLHLVSSMADHANAPLLVIGHGKTYAISDGQAKRSIMAVIQKANLDRKIKTGGNNATNAKNVLSDDIDDQIYWLRPKSRTPRTSPDSSSSENRFGWFTKKKAVNRNNGLEEMIALNGKYTNKRLNSTTANDADDDGDYVRLREIPMTSMNVTTPRGEHSDDTTSEDNKLLESVRNDTVTYASVNKELLNPSVEEFDDPSPLLTPEPEDHDDLPPPPPELSVGYMSPIRSDHQDVGKCLQRTDSGMPTEELPSRSDSEVSGGSPPDKTCSNSETSSGVHSNSSRESNRNDHHHHQSSSGAIVGLFNESMQKIQPQQWMQRNLLQQQASAITPYGMTGAATAVIPNRVYKPQQHYAIANKTPSISEVGEETNNSNANNNATVVIMRKNNNINQHQQHYHRNPTDMVMMADASGRFGRSTNMRLTSFTDHQPSSDGNKSSASTLPHYPTQPIGGNIAPYSHCSTMPPILTASTAASGCVGGIVNNSNNNNYGSFPRPHTTIPVHHNGVRFCNPSQPTVINPYAKRILPPVTQPSNYMRPIVCSSSSSSNNGGNNTQHQQQQQPIAFRTSHHTFPQHAQITAHHHHHPAPPNKYYLQSQQNSSERDSANFSTTSSNGDSETYNNINNNNNSNNNYYNNINNNNNNNNNNGTAILSTNISNSS